MMSDTLLEFRRYFCEVEGEPGKLYVNPKYVVSVAEETRRNPRGPQPRVAALTLQVGSISVYHEVLDEDRTAARRIIEALRRDP